MVRPMLFLIQCFDRPDAGSLRGDTRERHLVYLTSFGDRILTAGPTLTEDGTKPTGSAIIFEADSREAAQQFCDQDPYALAGLFSEVRITRWRQALPTARA